MKNTSMNMPANYTDVTLNEQLNSDGGRRYVVYYNDAGYRALGFLSYLLSNLTFSFNSAATHYNSDTITTTDGTRGSSYQHTNVDNVSSGQGMGISASFNLGGLFNALLRLFF